MLDMRDGLKVVIERSGMKQSAIAGRVNMTDQQLSDIVNKRRRLDANELVDLCRCLNIMTDDVFAAASAGDEVTATGEQAPPAESGVR